MVRITGKLFAAQDVAPPGAETVAGTGGEGEVGAGAGGPAHDARVADVVDRVVVVWGAQAGEGGVRVVVNGELLVLGGKGGVSGWWLVGFFFVGCFACWCSFHGLGWGLVMDHGWD